MQQLSVVPANCGKLLVFVQIPLLFFILRFLFLTFVASDPIVVSDFELFELSHLFLTVKAGCLCDVMEQAEHLAKVATIHHRGEVVDLLVNAENIQQVFNLLQRNLRGESIFFVLLGDALDHRTGISTASCLLDFL